MERVAVLLSTFNGMRFIEAQVTSIVQQSYRNTHLLWRDDGSTDDTIAIVAQHFGIQPLETDARHITGSYRRLLEIARDDGYDLFAFADQDDVWLNDKIERAVTAIRHMDGPALYCARQIVVDANLRRIGQTRTPQPGWPEALTENIAAGCTIMLNRSAATLVLQTLYDQPYHDWWCYLIVAAAGGTIVADDSEVMFYRQHTSNLIGAPSGFLHRAIAAVRRGPRPFINVLRGHVSTLQAHDTLLSRHARHDLPIIAAALHGGLRAKRRALALPRFRRQTFYENWLFRLWFLIG